VHTFHSPLLAQLADIARRYGVRAELENEDNAGNNNNDGDDSDDKSSSFVSRMAAKYEKEDSDTLSAEDGDGDEDGAEDDDHDDADDSDAGHAKKGTSADDPDGDDDAESDDDPADDDDDEHTDDDESDDSGDDDDADDEDDEGENDEEDDASDETKARLAKAGADLTLEDIPKEFRGIVEKKLRGVDQAFSRITQEATAFRADRTRFEAEEAFRKEHPAMFLAEMLANDDTLFDKVNAQFAEIADPLQAKAFKIVVEDTRKKAAEAIDAKYNGAAKQEERVAHVQSLTVRLAAQSGLPARLAEASVALAIMAKPANARDLTDEEITRIVETETKEFMRTNRSARREKSKKQIADRTKAKKAAPPATRGTSVASPRPGKQKSRPVDMNNEESRVGAMLRSAKRIMPGAR
jgi:hypothetical protein